MVMARSLLKGTHIPARFWGEAVRHAVYLLNRLPTKALGECTPFEAWIGRKSHLAHLRVFGCVAYVKNTAPDLKKLDDRSSPMVYLGVEEGYKAHRANKDENLPEFMVVDAFDTDEVIVAADVEAGAEHVTPPETAVVPMPRASSPSTPPSNAHAVTLPLVRNTPESHEGPVHFRSIVDIYANTEEVVGVDDEDNKVMMVMSEEPMCYQETATKAYWYEAMEEELRFIEMNKTWTLTKLPLGHKHISLKWAFKLKKDSTGKVVKHKARLVAKAYVQRQGINFEEVFAPVASLDIVRVILTLAANQSWEMEDCNATKHPMEPKTQLHKDLEGTPVDATEYRRIIGCLRYLLHTQPALSYFVKMASRYMERPAIMHHKVVKQILRYLKGTIHFGLVYMKGPQEIGIFGYSDSDLASDLDGRKSTSGMTFYFNESLVSWNSQKQKTVVLSSCEAEFMAATTAACHALWLSSLTSKFIGVEPKPVTLFVDNKSTIALMKNLVFHGRSKHIDTRFHFIRESIEKGQIVIEFINTGEQ
ncbi:hypothetical protein ZIOFF_010274 [Zingiber officinale]|uniref:Reverse transcriptase Ty1/copia-type domain-containing protein n=2 Tax=Zingiber officinale TaxID=94328 RepID=A0A8J5LP90_ZINOF|nr:hypothetical protein ZIOFF_010274 [Zingiber officinale]